MNIKKAKKPIVGVLLVAFVIAVVVNVNLTHTEATNDELILRNVEALAQGEGGEWECAGSGDILCPNGGRYWVVMMR